MTAVTGRKQEISASMENLNSRDLRLYRKLMDGINTFLSTKDSIRILTEEETLLKRDLKKCIDENKQATRKLTLGGITLPK
jgi:Mg2+/Co2+ transporter CorB